MKTGRIAASYHSRGKSAADQVEVARGPVHIPGQQEGPTGPLVVLRRLGYFSFMMDAWIASLEAWVRANAFWAMAATFLIAFLESFPVISLLIPSTAMLLAIGAMVGAGVLSPAPVLLACMVGGILGDALGFWGARIIGPYAVRRRLPTSWRRPYAWSTKVFLRWGWTAVFVGRFLGPMRAVAPLAAGVIGMGAWRFQTANILSAIIWAPVMIMPGSLGGWIAARLSPQEAPYALAVAAVAICMAWLLYRRLGPVVTARLQATLSTAPRR